MRVQHSETLADIAPADWNRLAGGENPFVRHEFLRALETGDCLLPYGWQPVYTLLKGDDGTLLGALPLYVKSNSYGEFVFDWSWASAYERSGKPYYPKLVCAVPFTPATGPRFLLHPQADSATARAQLLDAARTLARHFEMSSLHVLFTQADDTAFLQQSGLHLRQGCQFHWENQGWRDFQDYLEAFSSKKRKQIRRERRDAQACGVDIEILDGHQATDQHWERFHQFYASTFERKSGVPTLSLDFFQTLARTLPERIVLVMAKHGQEYVAGAFNLRGADGLYGRHYGCSAHFRHLHFEVCYYQTLDYCLAHGLKRFEAGAQGEHKLSRGFLPTPTWSAHWIADAEFDRAIAHFLQRETLGMTEYLAEMRAHSPFKSA